MRKIMGLLYCIIFFSVNSWFAYEKMAGGPYNGRSIPPGQHKGIPLVEELKLGGDSLAGYLGALFERTSQIGPGS